MSKQQPIRKIPFWIGFPGLFVILFPFQFIMMLSGNVGIISVIAISVVLLLLIIASYKKKQDDFATGLIITMALVILLQSVCGGGNLY